MNQLVSQGNIKRLELLNKRVDNALQKSEKTTRGNIERLKLLNERVDNALKNSLQGSESSTDDSPKYLKERKRNKSIEKPGGLSEPNGYMKRSDAVDDLIKKGFDDINKTKQKISQDNSVNESKKYDDAIAVELRQWQRTVEYFDYARELDGYQSQDKIIEFALSKFSRKDQEPQDLNAASQIFLTINKCNTEEDIKKLMNRYEKILENYLKGDTSRFKNKNEKKLFLDLKKQYAVTFKANVYRFMTIGGPNKNECVKLDQRINGWHIKIHSKFIQENQIKKTNARGSITFADYCKQNNKLL
jgi:hypothetical protein